jgi:hypothetical protein
MRLKITGRFYCRFPKCAALLGLSVLSLMCQKQESPVIARVGKAALTLKNLESRIPAEYSGDLSREQKINYVKTWVDNELLFQYALSGKLHREPEIAARLKQMKKDLLCAEVMSRNTVSPEKYPISEELVLNYYNSHPEHFIRESEAVRYLDITFGDKTQAAEVSKKISGANFADMAVKYSVSQVQNEASVPYVPVAALNSNLAEALHGLTPGEISGLVETETGIHIVRLLDRQPAGTRCPLEEVRGEIIGSMSLEIQKKHLETFLSGLKLKTDIGLHLDRIPGLRDSRTTE